MQFLDNRARFLDQNLFFYMGEILLQFWILQKYFSFLQSYDCINTLCHIFNYAWNNQQQLVIFIVKKHWLLLQIRKSHKYFIFAYVWFDTSPKSFREAQCGFVDQVLWHLVPYQRQNFLELMFSGWVEMTCSVQA